MAIWAFFKKETGVYIHHRGKPITYTIRPVMFVTDVPWKVPASFEALYGDRRFVPNTWHIAPLTKRSPDEVKRAFEERSVPFVLFSALPIPRQT